MSAIPKHRYSLAEYLERERTADDKSQFYQGEIFAMTGGTPNHNTAAGNVFAALRDQLRGTGCRPFNSDQRIRIPANGLSTYPDVSIVCGELQLDEQDSDAINNRWSSSRFSRSLPRAMTAERSSTSIANWIRCRNIC